MESMHLRFDQAMKKIFALTRFWLVPLILPGARWVRELSPELPGGARRVDQLWLIDYHGQPLALHLEIQTNPDGRIGIRIAEYIVRIFDRYDIPVRSFVIYLKPATNIPTSPFIISASDHPTLICHYDIIRLWELDPATVLNTPQPYLWPLAILMADTSLDRVRQVAERIIAEPLSRQDQSELLGITGLLAGLRIPVDAIMQALRRSNMIEDIWKESSYREVLTQYAHEMGWDEAFKGGIEAVRELSIKEGLATGMREGMREGLKEGVVTGQMQTMRQLAQEAVSVRFPDVPDDVRARIATLSDTDVLRRLILQAHDIPDLATLQAIIDAATPPPVQE